MCRPCRATTPNIFQESAPVNHRVNLWFDQLHLVRGGKHNLRALLIVGECASDDDFVADEVSERGEFGIIAGLENGGHGAAIVGIEIKDAQSTWLENARDG